MLAVLKFNMLNSQQYVTILQQYDVTNTCHVRFDIVFSHSKCILAQSEVGLHHALYVGMWVLFVLLE